MNKCFKKGTAVLGLSALIVACMTGCGSSQQYSFS